MKHKHNAGYSLVETVVAIAILAIIVTPISTGMVLAFKMNAKTEQLMQAELAVSSAVETLMAEGITAESLEYDKLSGTDRFSDVTVITSKENENDPYYIVEVAHENLSVTTYIREVEPPVTEPTDKGGSTS